MLRTSTASRQVDIGDERPFVLVSRHGPHGTLYYDAASDMFVRRPGEASRFARRQYAVAIARLLGHVSVARLGPRPRRRQTTGGGPSGQTFLDLRSQDLRCVPEYVLRLRQLRWLSLGNNELTSL